MAMISIVPAQQSQPVASRVLRAVSSLWPSRTSRHKVYSVDLDKRTLRDCGLSDHQVYDSFDYRLTARCII